MLKHLMIATGMSVILAGGAVAQTTAQSQGGAPATQAQSAPAPQTEGRDGPDQCLQSAMSLAKAAEDKKLNDAQLDKIEQMLSKMEDHCDAKQFSEAQAMAKDIEAALGQQ